MFSHSTILNLKHRQILVWSAVIFMIPFQYLAINFITSSDRPLPGFANLQVTLILCAVNSLLGSIFYHRNTPSGENMDRATQVAELRAVRIMFTAAAVAATAFLFLFGFSLGTGDYPLSEIISWGLAFLSALGIVLATRRTRIKLAR